MGVKVRERKGTYRYLTVGLLIILFHISMVIPTIAEQLKDADAAYLRGDYATAFDLSAHRERGIPRLREGATRT